MVGGSAPTSPALFVKKIHPDAKLPTRGTPFAIGLDMYALGVPDKESPNGFSACTLAPWTRRVVHTGIAAAIPTGFYGRVAPRSGLAVKCGIHVLAGVIDEDYRGDISVVLVNLSDTPMVINPGDRIGQLLMERADILPVLETDELPETARGASGFGSTGGFNAA